MKTILLIGAGKSSTCLIDYLAVTCKEHCWQLIIADSNLLQATAKAGNAEHVCPMELNVEDGEQRAGLIQKADIIISLLPAALHLLVAKDCVIYEKNLLTASYLDDGIRELEEEIKRKGLFFLCEMGLDPGIDHMSAMQLIHNIEEKGGQIISFKSHCGGLVAPESDNNPWHYKISWNPRNVVLAGNAGAVFMQSGQIISRSYEDLFNQCEEVNIPGIGPLSFYPNRDSLSYIAIYGLQNAVDFIRTTLRHPEFCKGWNAIVKAGLTDDKKSVNANRLTFSKWSEDILPYLSEENKELLSYLGLFQNELVPQHIKTSADILLYLLETNLLMEPGDKDMIVMMHEIDYISHDHQIQSIQSSLAIKGDDNVRTAMAKTVGLPLGIAAKLILQGKIALTGLHIPIIQDIYQPVMQELASMGIIFNELSFTRPA